MRSPSCAFHSAFRGLTRVYCSSETGRNAKAAQDRNEGIVTAAGTSADGYCTSFSVAFPSHTVRVDLYGERGLPLAIKEADALLIQGISNACFNFEEPKMLGTDLKTISRVLDIPLKSLCVITPSVSSLLERQALTQLSTAVSALLSGPAAPSKASPGRASSCISSRATPVTSSPTR